VSRRNFEKVMGKLKFASIVDSFCKTLLKEVNLFLRGHARVRLRDRKFAQPPRLRRFLRKWFLVFPLKKRNSWRKPLPLLDIHTDASMKGWGFHTSEGASRLGLWSL